MSWAEVEKKFLPLNRKRRADGSGSESRLKSESGKRFVMGRKGLGKLAGFGAAERVVVRTKRKGEDYATTVTMDDRLLKTAENVTAVGIPVTYETSLPLDESGTTVTLTGLKADAVKEKLETLRGVMQEAFNALRPEEMAISLNGAVLGQQERHYEYIYPEEVDEGGYGKETVQIEDVGNIAIRYKVGFTKRGDSLPARQRGARIYCNNRLAAGPSLFYMPTGMHSFHSTDYLDCVVEADALDREGVDLINTNRSQLREDNEVVRCLLVKVSELMREAVKAHSKFRDGKADEELAGDVTGGVLRGIVQTLPPRTREPAGKLLRAIAVNFGVGTPEFQELAPAFVSSVNATEVLLKLIRLRTDPETIARVAGHLRDLGEMEKTDVLKLYRGRRNGISALRILVERGEKEQWNKVGREKEMHSLLKECPWLIRPEFSNYTSSDQQINVVVSKIAEKLSIDKYAKITDGDDEDDTRPDLVFLMSDIAQGPHVINIVELKSPTFALKIEHMQQLERYLFQVSEWCLSHVGHPVSIRGYLIGAMPKENASSLSQKQIQKAYRDQGANPDIRILGVQELIQDAWTVHVEAIRALEKELGEDDSETPEGQVVPAINAVEIKEDDDPSAHAAE